MKQIYGWIRALIIVCLAISFSFCSKKSFLDAKPNQALSVPSTLKDYQAILDNDKINGYPNNGAIPSQGEVGSDDYYMTADYFQYLTPAEAAEYSWNEDPYPGISLPDWDYPYKAVFYANTVLEGVSTVQSTDQATIDNLIGSALFYRAFSFYQLAQVFAPQYDSSSSSTDLGIPLRLTADINEKISRATVQQTYEQIIRDINESIPLLPIKPLYKSRPSKPAAFGLLAKTYLVMRNYDAAFKYADSCLQLHTYLMDYNALDSTLPYPVPLFNDEVIYDAILVPANSFYLGFVDSTLYSSYERDDLRKVIFFDDNKHFRGDYNGAGTQNGGISTDEVFLIRAECLARKGDITDAMSDLNTLLVKRWRSGSFIPFNALNTQDALIQILNERRKELLFRGIRWSDLRRLNSDPTFAITLKRSINGQIITLPPGDLRYTWLIPDNILSFNPDMKQNPR